MDRKNWIIEQLSNSITSERMDKFRMRVKNRTRHITVVLENIYQPHNAAAVLRSCDGFGVQDAHIIENGNRFVPNKDVDMGASKWLTLHRYNERKNNTESAIKEIKKKGYKLVALASHAEKSIVDISVKEPIALIFGTEMVGLSDEAYSNANEVLKIPMYGFSESFNISVSVAITLFALTEKIRQTEKLHWALSNLEQQEVLQNWLLSSFSEPEILLSDLNRKFDSLHS